MCGIVGFADHRFDREKANTILREMNRAITHRGPDDTGEFSAERCHLGMSRLSIIDLETGKQPIYNEDKRYVIVQNGEIYNFRELKKELQEKGHRFTTNSDTEVIVHLYEEYGRDTPKYLKGMFCFCIYDTQDHKLFIARDRFGEKPLFYHHDRENGLIFSSEIKSLLQNPAVSRKLSMASLNYFFKFMYAPEPLTLVDGVYSLPAGHCMEYQDGRLTIEPYFTIDYRPDPALKTEDDVIEALNPILESAVKRQSISDVPLGAFLSGGIDSGTVVAKLAKVYGQTLKTFTVKFEESSYDESHIAREVAEKLGTDHTEITIPNTDFTAEIFWTIIDHVGYPFFDSSAIPSYFICKEFRKQVKVAISGDGGDEMFGGYTDFTIGQQIAGLKRFPSAMLAARAGMIGAANKIVNVNKLRQINKALTIARQDESTFVAEMHTMFEPEQVEQLWINRQGFPANGNPFALFTDFPKEADNWSLLRKLMYHRVRHNLTQDMLIKVDRMSMANSLEVRAPFLDVDVAEFSFTIPDKFLIRNKLGKYIIRRMMRDELPESVFNHPKSGFSIPLHKYQNDQYIKLAGQLFEESNPIKELFSADYLQQIRTNGLTRKKSKGDLSLFKTNHQLWVMMQLFGWAKRFEITI